MTSLFPEDLEPVLVHVLPRLRELGGTTSCAEFEGLQNKPIKSSGVEDLSENEAKDRFLMQRNV